ncbi:imelysin family protein [Bordetella petrii]|uniref:imelysin family protein n=1 Tax=Bordetella petrii TaxID=94624 RepID=UPI001E5B65D3|nr:imelysin family protein [Bordetella petrii]MCD0502440.1 imelysin family protein [Bordetella petrii]
MRKTKQCLLAAVVALAPWAAPAAPPADLGQRLADGYARPAVAKLVKQADGLEQALAGWCEAGGKGDAQPVRQAFRDTALAWAGVEFLRFGPLVQGNRYEKLAFWPDTRGVMQRQVRGLLAKADPALLETGALGARSVAMQGLPALEYVLYDEPGLLDAPAGKDMAYACRYAVAVAANIVGVATELQQAWSPQGDHGREFTNPRAGNDLYRSQQEVAAEAVKALSTGLQFARDVKLLPVIGESPEAARPKRAAFWRSGLALPMLAASVNNMRAFFDAGGYQYPEGEAWIQQSVQGELDRAAAVLQAQDGPLDQAVANAESWQRLALAALILKNAKDIVDQNFAPALGVMIGFNALDGD